MRRQAKKTVRIRLQQVLCGDGTVYSMQSVDLPARCGERVTLEFLLERYYALVRKITGSLIRPVITQGGVAFTLLGSRLALLRFLPPQYREVAGGAAAELRISGGFLVQKGECGGGNFSFEIGQVADAIRVSVTLSDFCPLLLGSTRPSLLRRMLYRLTQAYLHKVVTVRYLLGLYRELAGEDAAAHLEKVQVREGREI